ncbi:MAG TPA: hypothetical protein VGJ66_15360 [Pyrinomonadaceae bacterium]|jgi:hypothetical protein
MSLPCLTFSNNDPVRTVSAGIGVIFFTCKIHVAQTGFHAKRKRQTSDRRNQIGSNAIALRIIPDAVEDNCPAGFGALVDDFRQRRKLQVPVNVSTVIS